MSRAATYNTKQLQAVINILTKANGVHVTATEIVELLEKSGVSVGRATVYRALCKLEERGKVRRFVTDGVTGACYQLVDGTRDCDSHIHLKCESCGKLHHLECIEFEQLRKHICDEHAFTTDAMRTVLYGKCNDCAVKI